MGVITFHETYYRNKLSEWEGRKLSKSDLHEVKETLKVLDDLADEGYTNLNHHLEDRYQVLTRLRKLLSAHGETPFRLAHAAKPDVCYGTSEYEVMELCDACIKRADESKASSKHPFLNHVYAYGEWLDDQKDTAYVFLLRDALLPYIQFRSRGKEHLYPWLISRSFLYDMSGNEHMDDDIRLPIYEALEHGITEFDPFKAFCKKHICQILMQHRELEQTLRGLLNGIQQQNIMVIESGYCGTIPMLLASLDDRVDFRLYTTAPYLWDTYRDKIFCRNYEHIRLFETLCSQDMLTQYASFQEGKFYVNLVQDEQIQDDAIREISRFIGR